jgi:hypothetical protein
VIAVVIAGLALPAMVVVWIWWPGRRDADIAGPLVIVLGFVTCAVGVVDGSVFVGLMGLALLATGFVTRGLVRMIGARR